MADKLPGDPPNAGRSAIMRAVPRMHSEPELRVRKALFRLGRRFRLHRGDLPGTPDIVLSRLRLAVFVHGCFWHRHPGCKLASTPRTRAEFWQAKFARNIQRDAAAEAALSNKGWRVLIVWECETRNVVALADRLERDLARLAAHHKPTSTD